MRLRDDFKFYDKDAVNLVALIVMLFLSDEVGAKDIDYKKIVEYKATQFRSLVNGNYNITPETLMMYLSCPIGVENANDIKTFGIRTEDAPGNGKINMHLSKMILYRALQNNYFLDKIFDDEMDDIDTLPTKSDYLDVIAPSLLNEPALLYYLFFTGRGEEFTKIFNKTKKDDEDKDNMDKLTSFESGTFDGEETIKELTSTVTQGKENASQLLKDFVTSDKLAISILEEKKKQNEEPQAPAVGPVMTFN